MTMKLIVQGQSRTLHVTPIISGGVPWLPIRAVVEGLGGTVHWDPNTASTTLILGSDRLQIRLDQQLAVSNGTTVALLSAPELHAGLTHMTWFDLATYLPMEVEMTCSHLSPPPPQPLAGQSLCIDPGHGGDEPGALGPSGLLEKNVNLAVALRLAERLRQAGGQVLLTRDVDQTVSLVERSRVANGAQVGWFISIHSNSFADPNARGTETYHFPGDEAGRRLAVGVHGQLVDTLRRNDRGVKSGNFHVIRETTMPAILIELAFISNPEEERLLADPQFQERAAQAIYQGILNSVAQA